MLGFVSDRKYVLSLAMIFLFCSIISWELGLERFTEYAATLAYICLVVGVLKDIFYEKISIQ